MGQNVPTLQKFPHSAGIKKTHTGPHNSVFTIHTVTHTLHLMCVCVCEVVCRSSSCVSVSGAPVGVGMNIDIASIDMVSEVNMVSGPLSALCCTSDPLFPPVCIYLPEGPPSCRTREPPFSLC